MVPVASISAIGYFMPIFSFLLVFIIVYALLKKTEILGGNEGVMLFISFILASFFIVEASLVEFVQFSSAWFGVVIVGVLFLLLVLAFVPGIDIGDFLGKNDWFAWSVLGAMLIFFVFSVVYGFNRVINWGMLIDNGWVGMILLLAIAGVVSFVLAKK